jgi:outer membrane protein assembly factor BamB
VTRRTTPLASPWIPGLLLALLAVLPVSGASAADWPQIGGPRRDGVSAETGLLRSWPAAGPRVVWRRPLGEGFSGVAAVGGRLYTMDSDATTEFVLALDAATGAEVWRRAVGPRFEEDFGDGPRATPTVEDGTVYALGAAGRLVALAAADGAPRWQVDLPKELASPVPARGFTCSPLVAGDLLLLEAGGPPGKALVALDRQTGKLRWSARDGEAGYSSPLAVTLGGVPQVVFARRVASEVVALGLDGTVLWSHPGPPTVIAPPLFLPPDRIYVSGGDDAGAVLIRITTAADGKAKAETVWENRTMKNHFNPAVLVGEHLYGFDNGTFKCIAAATGQQTWAFRGLGKGSLIVADGLLLVLSDRGTLLLVEASPTSYTERGRFQAMTGRSWTAPTLAGGRLYLRDQDELVSLDLTTAPAAAAAAVQGD